MIRLFWKTRKKDKEKSFKSKQISFPCLQTEQRIVIGSRVILGNLITKHWHFNSSMHTMYPDVIEVSFSVFYDDWCLFEKSTAGLKLQNLLKETKKKDIQISQKAMIN